MNSEEKAMLIEMKEALTDTLEACKSAYQHSGYWQHIQYKADNDKYENWLFRAREAVKNGDEFLKQKS